MLTPPSRYYFFKNRHSGLVLGIRGASGAEGTPVVQWGQNGSADQVFLAVQMLNRHYLLCTNTASPAIGIANGAASAGAEVVQARPSGAPDQRFSIDYSGGQIV